MRSAIGEAALEVEMYSRILVAVDGSEASLSGLNEAIGIAEAGAGKVRLLHVVRRPELNYYFSPGEGAREVVESLCRAGKEILNAAECQVRGRGVIPECVLYESNEGSTASVILTQAQQWQADLIVMGSHARHAFVGHDTAEVLAEAVVPVLLMRWQAATEVH